MAGALHHFDQHGRFGGISLQWVTTQFNRESVLFRHAEDVKWSPFTKPIREAGKRLTPGSVALLAAVAVIVVGGVGGVASPTSPIQGVLVVQGALVALAALWVYRGGYDPVSAFGWKSASVRGWLGAFLAVAGGWVLTIQLATLQHMLFPFPEELLEQFRDLFAGLEDLPYWQVLVLIGLLPAVVEEHLCRGLMLRGLEDKSSNWRGIVVVAVIFAVLHLNPYRLLPTFALGLLLGYIAIQTRSIYPAILGHFMNNAASVSVCECEEQLSGVGWVAGDEAASMPWWWLAGGIVLFALGVTVLRTLSREESTPDTQGG
ncbi:MAG: CPBP family intramembrane metalloprotease [bacterium]|nr:CPBP family intramembrane metalloprotease [bacterium]